MGSYLASLVLCAVLVAGGSALPAFGQDQASVSISTDHASYVMGDKITITGEVSTITGDGVGLRVIHPDGVKIVTITQANVSSDGVFSVVITAGGPLWTGGGTYTVDAKYGESEAQAAFEYVVDEGQETVSIELDYTITGGTVESMTAKPASHSVTIKIEAAEDGEITVTLPRDVIDAKTADGADDVMVVLVDWEERSFEEISDENSRKITVAFEDTTEEIEIIGTFVIPEFGIVAVLILAAAIASIVVFSSRIGLPVMHRR